MPKNNKHEHLKFAKAGKKGAKKKRQVAREARTKQGEVTMAAEAEIRASKKAAPKSKQKPQQAGMSEVERWRREHEQRELQARIRKVMEESLRRLGLCTIEFI